MAQDSAAKEQVFQKQSSASALTIGVPKETNELERRVSTAPSNVASLRKGFNVVMEGGAGAEADFPDAVYQNAGAEIVSKAEAFGADIVEPLRRMGMAMSWI